MSLLGALAGPPTLQSSACLGVSISERHAVLGAGEVTVIDYALEDGRPSPFPVIRCRNVYVLPGVPHLLQQKWKVGPSPAPACSLAWNICPAQTMRNQRQGM